MKLYVASSWRNALYPGALAALRELGYDAMTDEVERDLPTYRDDEEAILPVPVLRELLRRAASRGPRG